MNKPVEKITEWPALTEPAAGEGASLVELTLPNGETIVAQRSIVFEFVCKRCDYAWQARAKHVPLKCPACYRLYWWKAASRKPNRTSRTK